MHWPEAASRVSIVTKSSRHMTALESTWRSVEQSQCTHSHPSVSALTAIPVVQCTSSLPTEVHNSILATLAQNG